MEMLDPENDLFQMTGVYHSAQSAHSAELRAGCALAEELNELNSVRHRLIRADAPAHLVHPQPVISRTNFLFLISSLLIEEASESAVRLLVLIAKQ